MISSARLGDKHVCPMPGHGTTQIESASADTNINFMGSARVGDTCGCGAVITTGFPSIQVNGRPMAHLGSPTSHGGTIITGSDDVGGGFVMGRAGGATIIDFMALGAIRPDGTVDEEKMATLLADPKLKEKAVAANALVDSNSQPIKQDAEKAEPAVCNHPDKMEELADYIAGEMNRNIHDPAVLEMRRLIDYDPEVAAKQFSELPLLARMGGRPNFKSIALANKAAAFVIWTGKVGQDMDWDHKKKIPKIIGGVWHKQGDYDYFYDIWSNIHYGYVGVAGGLTDAVLLDGAGVEQIGSDLYRQAQDSDRFKGPHRTEGVEGMRAWDDAPDRVSIDIGIKLYSDYPDGGITAKIIMDKVLAVPIADWAKGVQEHVCQ